MTDRSHRVAVLALDGVVAFDLGMPVQVLRRGPRRRRRTGSTRSGLRRRTAHRSVSARLPACCPSTGRSCSTAPTPSSSPGIHRRPRAATARSTPDGRARPLRPRGRPRRPLVSICTGRLRAGRRRAARRPPGHHALVLGRPVPAAVPRGAARTRTCSSSTTATCSPRPASPPESTSACTSSGATTAAAVANRAARRCVVPPWRDGGQAQFIERPVPAQPDSRPPAPARAWVLDHLDAAARPGRAGRARPA